MISCKSAACVRGRLPCPRIFLEVGIMSNEELAAAIKAGNTDLYSDLWNQVQRFVVWKARQRYVLTNGVGGVEVEDLVQSGFLALVSAEYSTSELARSVPAAFISVVVNTTEGNEPPKL